MNGSRACVALQHVILQVPLKTAEWCVSLPSKSLRSSKISRSLSLITFPLDPFTSLSGTKVTAKCYSTPSSDPPLSKHLNDGVEDAFSLLGASGFEQLHQLIQINATFTLVQLCLPTFELICGGKQQKKRNHLEPSSAHCLQFKMWCKISSKWFGYPIKVKPLTLVDDHLLQLPLGRGPLQDLLVDSVGCDQAVHHHWFGLPDAVAAVLSL